MNYHKNSYTGSGHKKLLIRVLIVVAALTVVCAVTFAYGNYLKDKAEKTLISGSGAGRDTPTVGAGRDENEVSSQIVKVKSHFASSAALENAEKAPEFVQSIVDAGGNGVTVALIDREGYLTYPSEAVAKFTHQRPASGDPGPLKAIISAAKASSLRTSALIFALPGFEEGSFSAEIDALVAADCAAFGFDELIVVLPIESGSLESERAGKIVAYLNALGASCQSTALGVCLPYDVYGTPSLSPQLDLISRASAFLAIDLTGSGSGAEEAAEYVKKAAETISGTFSLYSLRAILDASDADVAAAQIKALSDKSIDNYMFISSFEPDIPNDSDTAGNDDDGAYTPEPPPAQTAPVTAAPDTSAPAPVTDDTGDDSESKEPDNDEPGNDSPAADESEDQKAPDSAKPEDVGTDEIPAPSDTTDVPDAGAGTTDNPEETVSALPSDTPSTGSAAATVPDAADASGPEEN